MRRSSAAIRWRGCPAVEKTCWKPARSFGSILPVALHFFSFMVGMEKRVRVCPTDSSGRRAGLYCRVLPEDFPTGAAAACRVGGRDEERARAALPLREEHPSRFSIHPPSEYLEAPTLLEPELVIRGAPVTRARSRPVWSRPLHLHAEKFFPVVQNNVVPGGFREGAQDLEPLRLRVHHEPGFARSSEVVRRHFL